MVTIIFNNNAYPVAEKQTVLETLESKGEKIPYSCRVGLCHACLMKSDVPVPEQARRSLSALQKSQHYFLACQCLPEKTMTVSLPSSQDALWAMVSAKVPITDSVLELHLLLDKSWFPGQTVTLFKEPGVGRDGCLARSIKDKNISMVRFALEENCEVSQWLAGTLEVNQSLLITGPKGVCHYTNDALGHELLLVSSAICLPAMVGIVDDALKNQHSSKISVYYQADSDGTYAEQLTALADKHSNVKLHCLEGNADGEANNLINSVKATDTKLRNHKVFLLGDTEMVNSLQRHCFFKGAVNSHIKTVIVKG